MASHPKKRIKWSEGVMIVFQSQQSGKVHDRLEEAGGHLVRGVGFFERELMMDLNLRLSEPLEKTTTFSPCVLLMICDFLFLDHVSSKAHSLFLYTTFLFCIYLFNFLSLIFSFFRPFCSTHHLNFS